MSIVKILLSKNFDIDTDVMSKASEIFNDLGYKLIREKKKMLKILFCLYNAYLHYDRPVDIRVLAYKLELPENTKISQIFTLCSPINTGYQFIRRRFTVNEYVKFYANEMSSLNTLQKEKIVKIGEEIYDKIEKIKKGDLTIHELDIKKSKKGPTYKEKLLQTKRQNISAGIVMYYLKKILNDKDCVEEFKKKLFRSTATIVSLCTSLNIIHNYT